MSDDRENKNTSKQDKEDRKMIQKHMETFINRESFENPVPMKLKPVAVECNRNPEMQFTDPHGTTWIQVHHFRRFPVIGYILELWDVAESSIYTEPRLAAKRRLGRLMNPLTALNELKAIRHEQNIRKQYNGGDGVLKIETPDGPIEIAVGGVDPKNKLFVSVRQVWGKVIITERITNLQDEVLNEYHSTVEWVDAWGIHALIPRDSVDEIRASVGIEWPAHLRNRFRWIAVKNYLRWFFRIRSKDRGDD